MTPLGRPPLTRGVFSYEDPVVALPAQVTLDTSFAASALISGEDGHDASRTYLARLIAEGSVIYFSRLLELELREVAFKTPLVETYRGRWRRHRHDGRSMPRARKLLQQTMDSWAEILDAADHLAIEVDEIADRVDDLMCRDGLSSYDAVHAATALYTATAGSPAAIVTRDLDYALAPEAELTVYTNEGRVRRSRSTRSRAQVVSHRQ